MVGGSRQRVGVGLIALAMLGCGGGGRSSSGPADAPAPVAPAPVAPAPQDRPTVFSPAALRAQVSDLYDYPPTRCRLRALLGADFARLTQRGGTYAGEAVETDGGYAHFGARCPQRYCDTALTWIHPDGAIVVALHQGTAIELFTNRAARAAAVPAAVREFLDERARAAAPATVDVSWRVATDRVDPAPCRDPAEAARTARFEAAQAGRACDAEFSPIWGAAVVRGRPGARVRFVDPRGRGHAGGAIVRGGELVRTGWPAATAPALVCAERITLAGERTVGWLPQAALRSPLAVELPGEDADLGASLPDATLAAVAAANPGPTPRWLASGAPPRRFGELTIGRRGARVSLELRFEVAGHDCDLRGALTLVAPRVIAGGGELGCEVVGVLLEQGVYLWEDGGCSGRRASCTGGYGPLAPSVPTSDPDVAAGPLTAP